MMSDSVWRPYTQMQTAPAPLTAVRTEGSRIYLDDGRCLIDGVASWWTACHGYNHPAILAAIENQLKQMPHVMLGGLVHEPVLTLSQRLTELTPGDIAHFFYSESGSIAIEVAMKMALQFWINQGKRERRRFVSFRHAYHGDTFAAMSVCDPEEGMHTLFRGSLADQLVVDLPESDEESESFQSVLDRESESCAALIVEPLVQAAGGMKFHEPTALTRIAELAREYGLLVIFDEIATGFGRTGSLFACEQAGVVPDIITLSKSLTGGTMPLAVTGARRFVFDTFASEDPIKALMHGPTFSGHPLACAAANASIDLFRTEPRLDQVARIEHQLLIGLSELAARPGVVDVRVKGAIGVVQLTGDIDVDDLRQRFIKLGVWVRPFADIVYLMPAFTIAPDELGLLIDAVNSVVTDWSSTTAS